MSKFVYMNIAKGSKVMRLRGEVPDNYTGLASHIRRYTRLGYVVQAHDEQIGSLRESVNKHTGRVVHHIEYDL